MRRMLLKFLTIFLYLILLLSISGFHFTALFDLKSLILTLGGALFLSIASLAKGMSKQELIHIFCWNAIVAGYLITFVFLFASLSRMTSIENLLSSIALNCRSLLYGFIVFVVLRNDDNDVKRMPRINNTRNRNDRYNNIDKTKKEVEVTLVTNFSPEEIYYKFREMSLTQREAEIARLARSGLSNKEIADEMYIAESTVKKHMSHVFEKLNLSCREELKNIF